MPGTNPPIVSYCVPGPRLIRMVLSLTHAPGVSGSWVRVGTGTSFEAFDVGTGVWAGDGRETKRKKMSPSRTNAKRSPTRRFGGVVRAACRGCRQRWQKIASSRFSVLQCAHVFMAGKLSLGACASTRSPRARCQRADSEYNSIVFPSGSRTAPSVFAPFRINLPSSRPPCCRASAMTASTFGTTKPSWCTW